MNQNTWYSENIDTIVQNESRNRLNQIVEVDVLNNGIAAHSAGGEIANNMVILKPSIAKAFWLLDPVMRMLDNGDSHAWIAEEPKYLSGDQVVARPSLL